MKWAKFTLFNQTHPQPHDKFISINMEKILWVRPFIISRQMRDEEGIPLPYKQDKSNLEFVNVIALGYGGVTEEDTGEVIVIDDKAFWTEFSSVISLC